MGEADAQRGERRGEGGFWEVDGQRRERGERGGEEQYLDCFQASSKAKLAFSDGSVLYYIIINVVCRNHAANWVRAATLHVSFFTIHVFFVSACRVLRSESMFLTCMPNMQEESCAL